MLKQTLLIVATRNLWSTVRRFCFLILGLKGCNPFHQNSLFPELYWKLCWKGIVGSLRIKTVDNEFWISVSERVSAFEWYIVALQRMDDTSGPVRDATAEALGTLLKVMGERPLNPYIEQLDKIKMDKVCYVVMRFMRCTSQKLSKFYYFSHFFNFLSVSIH